VHVPILSNAFGMQTQVKSGSLNAESEPRQPVHNISFVQPLHLESHAKHSSEEFQAVDIQVVHVVAPSLKAPSIPLHPVQSVALVHPVHNGSHA
jgi:hypothetical protein